MSNAFIFFFIVIPLVIFYLYWYFKKSGEMRKRIYKVGEKKYLLTKKDILEMSRKNYGTHSWYKKMKK